MEHANYLKEVRAQYEELPYPPCNPEDERKGLTVTSTCPLDLLNHYCFEGAQSFDNGFRVLVAGGGTGNSAILLAEQLRDRDAEVVYLDMSAASMALAKKRAEIRGLTNITWVHDSLLELPKRSDLGKFDLVNCTGVLHHLMEPEAGLAALNSVMKDDGAMALMVYATYGRQAVYQMQDILRRLNRNAPDTATRLDHAKAMLKTVEKAPWAAMFRNPESDNMRFGDSGIYDLLLHSQDRPYTVPQIYEFLGLQKLRLRRFLGNLPGTGKVNYSPFHVVDPSLYPVLQAMSEPEQQALAELIRGDISTHTFYASRKATELPSPQDMDMIPSVSQLFSTSLQGAGFSEMHREFADIVEKVEKDHMVIQHSKVQLRLAITPNLKAIVRQMDGSRSIREICEKVCKDIRNTGREAPALEVLHQEFIRFYTTLNVMDIILLRKPDVRPYETFRAMQRRLVVGV